jgi:hypothetical protein
MSRGVICCATQCSTWFASGGEAYVEVSPFCLMKFIIHRKKNLKKLNFKKKYCLGKAKRQILIKDL